MQQDVTLQKALDPGDQIPLQLAHCIMPEDVCSGLLQDLRFCTNLNHLDLSGNSLGDSGRLLAETTGSWGYYTMLQVQLLNNCQISEDACGEIAKSLASVRYLSSLDLSGNILSESGRHLADTIKSRGYNSCLQQLVRRGCAIPEDVCGQIVKSLASCRLTLLDLLYNTLSDAGQYLTQNITSSLKMLHLRSCQMSHVI